MTYRELISITPEQIKGNTNLVYIFKEAYKNVYNYYPSCTSCSLNNELKDFIRKVKELDLLEKEIQLPPNHKKEMEALNKKEKTYRLKDHELSIFTYINKDNNVVRKFVEKADDEFVINFLTNGTKEEIESRKQLFSKLPDGYNNEKSVTKEKLKK